VAEAGTRKFAAQTAGSLLAGGIGGRAAGIALPVDFERKPGWDFAGDLFYFQLGKPETAGLKELAKFCEVTLYMVLVSVYMIFFG